MSYSGQCVDTSVGLVLLEEERAAELQAGGDDAGSGDYLSGIHVGTTALASRRGSLVV